MIKNNGCCNLEYAQRLEELGCPQDSLWCYVYFQPDNNYELISFPKGLQESHKRHMVKSDLCGKEPISAYTCAELLKSLPPSIIYKKRTYWLHLSPGSQNDWLYLSPGSCYKWYADYYNDSYKEEDKEFLTYWVSMRTYRKLKGDTPANALAKRKIWLIKNKYTKGKEK